VLLGAWLLPFAAAQWRQHQADVRWAESDAFDAAKQRPAIVPPPPELARPVEGVDFRLRVPRIEYQALVHEGVSSDSLFGGPGHYPESRWPGQSGNVAVAAHNMYWLRFDELKRDDQVIVETRYGPFRYRVTGTQIVSPDDRSVLADAPGRRLTLTTCWPLWAGQFATSRLAVFAA
jgi:sortase A